MGVFKEQLLHVFARASVPDQSVISGLNPVKYNASDPAPLWIIQVIIIMAMTQLLSLVLSRIRQPRVIAEVIAGVILGPTVMGRIPGFTQAIFPQEGMAVLRLTSTIGLVFFLFIVGLEIDTRVMKHNMVASATVSIAGLIFPLGLGAALGVGVYREFINPSVNFGIFLLFTAVAVGITAFPVLCRILTSLDLLETEVGLVTLAAGIGNDVIGWVLLALTVALVNASSGLTALWVLLASAGYTVFLLFPVRWGYRWLAKRTGSIERGTPSSLMMTITLFIVLISAFFTDIIGVHPIFGGFLAGLIIPHDNGYTISIVEKLEDLVIIILLPLYFVLSGLSTNLALLNTGICWAYIIIICLVAFTSKFVACGGTALLNGYNWREAGAIGSLMSCKGLVELIVLNIGFQAGILDSRTFSMFVVHALILTFMTTPLVLMFYPAKYRVHRRGQKAGDETATGVKRLSDGATKTKFAIILDKIEALPAAMTLSQLLSSPFTSSPLSSANTSVNEKAIDAGSDNNHKSTPPVTVGLLRLIELTDRTSAVLKSQEAASSFVYNDPVISVYRTFGQLNRLNVNASVSVVSQDQFPDTVAKHASDTGSQMTIIPWPRGATTTDEEHHHHKLGNPFDGVFHKTTAVDQTSSVIFSEFIRNVFAKSPSDVALFVDRGLNAGGGGGGGYGYVSNNQHLFLPFFGGPDDRLALKFLGQLCENPSVTATVVRLVVVKGGTTSPEDAGHTSPTNVVFLPDTAAAAADTVYGQSNTQIRLESDTADNLTWEQISKPTTINTRITFHTETTSKPLGRAIELIKAEASLRSSNNNNNNNGSNSNSNKTMIVLAGRSRRMAVESLRSELYGLINESGGSSSMMMSAPVPKTLGDLGAALVLSSVDASLLVLQAAPNNDD